MNTVNRDQAADLEAAEPAPWLPRSLAVARPAAVAGGYAAFGLAWVVSSDHLLQWVAGDMGTLTALGQSKGVAFVLATSGVIYVIASRRGHTDVTASQPQPAVRPLLLWVIALLSAAVVLAGLVSNGSSAHKAHEQRVAELRRQAELKAQIVEGWTQRRIDEARQLMTDVALRDGVQRWRRQASDVAPLRAQVKALLATGRYVDALLLDERAEPALSVDGALQRMDEPLQAAARLALRGVAVRTTDFYVRSGNAAGGLQFDLLIPMLDDDSHTAALLVLRTAPSRQLLPQLVLRADDADSQTLLMRPDARQVVSVDVHGAEAPRHWARSEAGRDMNALAEQPSLAGALMDGLADDGGHRPAVAAAVRNSNWFIVVQTSPDAFQGDGAWHAVALALVNILAVLAAGAVLYAGQQRRERQVASSTAADRQEKARAWKVAEAIANCSTDIIFAKDLQGRYLFVNRELCKVLGRRADELVGADASALFPPSQVRRLVEDDAGVLGADKPLTLETQLTMAGNDRTFTCTKGRLVDDDGGTVGIYGVATDVTERRDLQQRMRQWATVFEDIRDGVIITDATGCIQAVNRAFTAITGFARDEAVGASLKLLKSGRHGVEFYQQMWATLGQEGHWQGEIWNRRKSGEVYPEWLTISAVRDGDGPVTHYVGVFTDISQIKNSEAQADWLFHHDPLTRLPNRVMLQRRLEQVLARSRRHEARAVLMVLDLDGFKTVNDSLGHPAGDELLVCVAERLKSRLRQTDFLGRLGGDEFLVILDAGPDATCVAALARDLLTAVSAPVALSCGQDAYLTASIGITLFPEDGSPTAVELLRDADAAMYRAKELGRNRFCFYTGDMNEKALAKLDLEAALSRAIERDELLLHYQPKVAAHSGEVVGAEALLRWQRTGVGLVPPGQFIPLAEHSSLILAIGAWVIDAACRQVRNWMDAGLPVVRIAVNVAARQFSAGDLDTVVADALARHGVPPHCLELELTEGMLMCDPQGGTAMLQRLRALGVKVSLDDFGTGYSSLAYLQQFPIDALKIDQSFVRRIGEVPDGEALVDAVIALAHRLHLRVVAEGVETVAQREYLSRQGCDEMQGYHFGRPDTPDALQRQLAAPALAA